MKKILLIVGSGGRERALGWKLHQSKQVDRIYFEPGNGGTGEIGENISIEQTDIGALLKFAKTHAVNLTVVGPETPLALGIVDRFTSAGLRIFGPSKRAARLEASKVWATSFMKRHDLPGPVSKVFTRVTAADAYVKKLGGQCVI